MAAKCETISKYILPVFRSLVAKELVKTYNLTQIDAAKRLGTTQAAVSQYLNSKRAIKGNKQFTNMMPKIQQMAKETAKILARKETNWNSVTADFCRICSNFSEEAHEQTGDNYSI